MPPFGFGRSKSPKRASEQWRRSPGGVYEGLREMVLGLDARNVGVEPSVELPRTWGVVVDWGVGTGSAIFVALADGTSSMYTRSGGGVIGGGGHESVRAAGRRLLMAAEAALDNLASVDTAQPPDPELVTNWVLAYDGMRAVSHPSPGRPGVLHG